MALEIFRLVGSIFVDNTEADKSLAKTDEKAQSVGQTFLKGVETAGKWGAAIVGGATAAAAGVVKLATSAAGTADEIDKMSQKIGISAQGYQEWSYVLGQNGMDIDKLQTGIKTLVTQMDAARTGSDKATAAFDALGLSIYDDTGALKGQEQMMNEALLALADLGDTTERAALANQLFGRSGTELAPVLNTGSDGIRELTQRAHDLGLVLGDDAVKAGVKLGDTIDDVKRSAGAIATQLGTSVFPIVQRVAEYILQYMPILAALFDEIAPVAAQLLDGLLPPLVQLVEQLLPVAVRIIQQLMPVVTAIVGNLLPPLIQLLSPVLDLLGPILDVLQPILSLITSITGPLASLMSSLLTPLVTLLGKLIEQALVPLRDQMSAASTVLSSVFKSAVGSVLTQVNNLKTYFTGIINFVTGTFTGDWRRAWTGIKDIFSSIWEGIKAAFKAPINFIIDGINGFIRGVNKVQIPDWVPGVGGKGLNIAEIPRLARGGILERGQIGLLEGSGAEAVVPLENNRAWTQAVARDMTGALGGEDVAKRLDAILVALERLSGMGIYLDTGKLVGEIADPLDRVYGDLQYRRARA